MGRTIKYLLYVAGGLVALILIIGVAFALLFDPNDYRENIADAVMDETGRELIIEGDLDVSLFPWLAVEIGATRLGNAKGFGENPFMSFDHARLSVRLLPLVLRREIVVGTATIDALELNLRVKKNGVSNWQDLSEQGEADAARDATEATEPGATLDIAGIAINDATIKYNNAQLGEKYSLKKLNLNTGAVKLGEPVDISGGFSFKAEPAGASGTVEMETRIAFQSKSATILFDDLAITANIDGLADTATEITFSAPAIVLNTEERMADVGSIELSLLDIDIAADVEAFSYADSPAPKATISIAAFSPRNLMRALDVDAPDTADPSALGKLIVDARAVVDDNNISLRKLVLVLDETTFRGKLVVPRASNGIYQIDLAADNIDLNRYMAPAGDAGGDEAAAAELPVEIPADMIRGINARGKLAVTQATMGRMLFENVALELKVADDQLRAHPISAEFFDGGYMGDIRIDASGKVPVLSVNEQVHDVSLASLGEAMFQQKNLTGTIDGTFKLRGRGRDMGQIQRNLRGNMAFTLKDGAFEGTDVWYELRKARAMFKNETPPEPVLPARTQFSEVSATGKVTDGVLRNDDFIAELPFMRLSGQGSVNMPEATMNYSLKGKVFDKPEFMGDVTAEEISDLTKVEIPLLITGPLASPKIGVDFESLLKQRVQEEVEDKLDEVLEGLFKKK